MKKRSTAWILMIAGAFAGCGGGQQNASPGNGSGSGPVTPPVVTPVIHTEFAHMDVSAADQACLQLKDADTWTTKLAYLSGVGTVTNLTQLFSDLDNSVVQLTSTTRPSAVGYLDGIRWSDTDMATNAWIPQGVAFGVNGGAPYAVASWHFNNDYYGYNDGSRVSIVDMSNPATAKYRNVILVDPTGTGTYQSVNIHVGGVAIAGNYLYVADTSNGFRVFDMSQMRKITGDDVLCKNSNDSGYFGQKSGAWCAAGYGYMLPQVSAYTMPSTKSDGTAITSTCKPKFSFAGLDARPATPQILSGEYCNNTDQTCEGDTTGLNGRLYQWPLGAHNKLITSSLYVSPTRVYFMNVRNIQGVAPVTRPGNETDSYYLGATRYNGAVFKSTPTAATKTWSYSSSQVPWHVEGLHATADGRLWILTEGQQVTSATQNPDPKTGGRVLIQVDQSSLY
ncbi:MAG: hypothetical protein JSS87_05180 [Acidobacteria bacterium]|nr:hypothetical protein [Acidobacteriota bacterium]